jgi:hypothetical protein
MTFRRLVPYLTFLAIVAMAIRPSIDTDTWWHLRAGEWILDHRQILRQDVFSLTMTGAAWAYPGWLAEIVMASIQRLAGLSALSIFTTTSVIVGLAFVWPLLEGPLLLRAVVLLLAAASSAIYWSARPQILSFALTGATLYLIDRAVPPRPTLAWVLPAVLALWANVHGGFAIGLILVGAAFFGEGFEALVGDPARGISLRDSWTARRRRLLWLAGLGVASALAVGVNPFGLSMLAYPWKTVSIGALQTSIQEWQSPDFHSAAVHPFLAMLVGLLISIAASRRPMTAVEAVRTAAFTAMALLAARNIASFALVAAPTLARHLASSVGRWPWILPKSRPLPEAVTRPVNLLLALALTVGVVAWGALELDPETIGRHIDRQIPRQAFEQLAQQHPPGNLFHSYNWGGYVLWSLYPDYPSFVDGRTDVFSAQVLDEYLEAWAARPGWAAVLDKYNIDNVLVEPVAPLAQRLTLSGWIETYRDDQAVLLRRPRLWKGGP